MPADRGMNRGNHGGAARDFGRDGMKQRVDFQKLAQDGAISQETLEAIETYMRDNASERVERSGRPVKGEVPAEGEAPAEGETPAEGEAPAEDETPAEGEASRDDARPDLLQDLLDNGVITQAEYDAITAASQSAVDATASATPAPVA